MGRNESKSKRERKGREKNLKMGKMETKIWNEGKYWEVNEYNKRLSKENKIIVKADKKIRAIKIKRDKEIKQTWKKKK